MGQQLPIDDTRRQVFLDHLRQYGIATAAAKAASPHASERHGAVAGFRQHAKRDPEFAAAWEAALEEAREHVEMELHRRAVVGWEEPVYQRGELVGSVTKFSDRLLELRAKGLMPERYAVERRDVNVKGSVAHAHVGVAITPQDLLALNESEREQLSTLLEKVADARGED